MKIADGRCFDRGRGAEGSAEILWGKPLPLSFQVKGLCAGVSARATILTCTVGKEVLDLPTMSSQAAGQLPSHCLRSSEPLIWIGLHSLDT